MKCCSMQFSYAESLKNTMLASLALKQSLRERRLWPQEQTSNYKWLVVNAMKNWQWITNFVEDWCDCEASCSNDNSHALPITLHNWKNENSAVVGTNDKTLHRRLSLHSFSQARCKSKATDSTAIPETTVVEHSMYKTVRLSPLALDMYTFNACVIRCKCSAWPYTSGKSCWYANTADGIKAWHNPTTSFSTQPTRRVGFVYLAKTLVRLPPVPVGVAPRPRRLRASTATGPTRHWTSTGAPWAAANRRAWASWVRCEALCFGARAVREAQRQWSGSDWSVAKTLIAKERQTKDSTAKKNQYQIHGDQIHVSGAFTCPSVDSIVPKPVDKASALKTSTESQEQLERSLLAREAGQLLLLH